MAKKPKPSPPYNPNHELEAEDRLGQCLVAFGAGAGPIRIRREAVRWFVDRLTRPFQTQAQRYPCGWLDPADFDAKADPGHTVQDYQNHGSQITDLSRAVGRLAAHYATVDGRFAINENDVTKAFAMVSKTNLGPKPRAGIRGQYCNDGR